MSVSFLLFASALILRTQHGAMQTVCLLALCFWYAKSAHAKSPSGSSVRGVVRGLSPWLPQQLFQARQRNSSFCTDDRLRHATDRVRGLHLLREREAGTLLNLRDRDALLFHVHGFCFLGRTEIHALLVEQRELVHDQADGLGTGIRAPHDHLEEG